MMGRDRLKCATLIFQPYEFYFLENTILICGGWDLDLPKACILVGGPFGCGDFKFQARESFLFPFSLLCARAKCKLVDSPKKNFENKRISMQQEKQAQHLLKSTTKAMRSILTHHSSCWRRLGMSIPAKFPWNIKELQKSGKDQSLAQKTTFGMLEVNGRYVD